MEDPTLGDSTLGRVHRHAGTIRLYARLAVFTSECRNAYPVHYSAARMLINYESGSNNIDQILLDTGVTE